MSNEQKPENNAYRDAGVDYEVLDAGKRLALDAARATSSFIERWGGNVLERSRGGSAFVFQIREETLALVVEGLGTKSIIARVVAEELGVNRFDAVAYDAVAAIINDLCCVGAQPLVLNAYFATGAPEWFNENEKWYEALVEGWAAACADAGCTWGGGESPSLPGLVIGEEIELAGSAVGAIPPKRRPIEGEQLTVGDEIVLIESNGIHANGSSLARMVAKRLRDGYGTRLRDGSTLGEALLKPSFIYSEIVESALTAGLPLTYLSHITGHGLLKLMRPTRDFTYRIKELLPVPSVLEFLVHEARMSTRTAYCTFNMGCGFAIYCASGAGPEMVEIAARHGRKAIVAGFVERGERCVVVEPLGIRFGGEELRLAPSADAD
jgi:phosphoribosylformylglycinamidine cyclo-ligase